LPNNLLDFVEIRHPFHPLRGQRFALLKQRRVAGVDTLVLADPERGSFAIPREWTDRELPKVYLAQGVTPRRLDVTALCDLVELIAPLLPRRGKKSSKGLVK